MEKLLQPGLKVGGTTVKHFYREGKPISLMASNPNYPPITVDAKEMSGRSAGYFVVEAARMDLTFNLVPLKQTAPD